MRFDRTDETPITGLKVSDKVFVTLNKNVDGKSYLRGVIKKIDIYNNSVSIRLENPPTGAVPNNSEPIMDYKYFGNFDMINNDGQTGEMNWEVVRFNDDGGCYINAIMSRLDLIATKITKVVPRTTSKRTRRTRRTRRTQSLNRRSTKKRSNSKKTKARSI